MKHVRIIQMKKVAESVKPFEASHGRGIVCSHCMRSNIVGVLLLLQLARRLLLLLQLLLLLLIGRCQKLFRGVLVAVRLPHVHGQDRLGRKRRRAVQALEASARSRGVRGVMPLQVAVLVESWVGGEQQLRILKTARRETWHSPQPQMSHL